MSNHWPPYTKYKGTDLDWLPRIPERWYLRRAKFLFHKMDRSVRDEDQVVTAFRDGEVTLRSNRRTEGFTFSIKEIGYQGVRRGDLVIHAMDGFAGAIGVSDSDGKCSPVYSVCVAQDDTEVNLFYYGYLLRHMALTGFILSLAKGIRERSTDFRYNVFGELFLPLPLPSEQCAIAAFLHRETAHIDALISEQRRLIELLQERRAAVISHAVTKGLDPEVLMRHSGVEWLGEIPAHWEVKRLKFIAGMQTGVAKGRNLDGRETIEVPYLRVANVQSGYVDLADVAMIAIGKDEIERYSIRAGDILMTEGGDYDKLGRGTVWNGQIDPCIHQNHVFAVRAHPGVDPHWISLMTQADYARHYFIRRSKQTTNLGHGSS